MLDTRVKVNAFPLLARPLAANCHRGLGTLYAKAGQREQTHTALTVAIDLYRAMELPFWLPQAEAALAQVHAALSSHAKESF
jgi:hypothetical protein